MLHVMKDYQEGHRLPIPGPIIKNNNFLTLVVQSLGNLNLIFCLLSLGSYLFNKINCKPFEHHLIPSKMHFTSYTFCQAGSECHPVLRIRFLHHGRDLRTGHLTFWDPFLVYFEESERVQGSFLCKGVKRKGSQKLSSLFTVGTSWISHGISLQRLGVWECKRPFMKLDILGFLMALEWPNLG